MSGPKSSFRAKAPQVFCHTEQSGVFTRGCSDATRRSCSQDGPHHPLAASGRILCPPAGCLIGLSFVKSFGFILVPFYGLQGQSYHASVPKARTLKHQMDKNSEKLLQIQFRKAGLGPVTRTEEGQGCRAFRFCACPSSQPWDTNGTKGGNFPPFAGVGARAGTPARQGAHSLKCSASANRRTHIIKRDAVTRR